MTSLLLLCAAATGVVAFGVSGVAALGLFVLRGTVGRLAAVAQARVLLFVAVLPALVAAAVMAAALAPSFGLILDHCFEAFDPHAHPHICAAHHQPALPSVLITLAAGLFLLRVAVTAARLVRAAIASTTARRDLEELATSGQVPGALVLPFDEPQAFLVGIVRPMLYVTRGLLSPEHRGHLDVVLAHEQAHVRRRDALRRLVAFGALAFHLPVVAVWIERRLARAHEMAADAEAAMAIGSPRRVASALVGLLRAARRAPRFALAFGGSDVESRVAALLDARPRANRPGVVILVAATLLGVGVVLGGAEGVHHGVELMLGILGG
jgi:Zn-dependent protease with chaperone function